MANPDWADPSDFNDPEQCDGCGEQRVIREVLDGDKLCQGCCDAWVGAEGQAEAEHKANEAEALSNG